MSENIRIGDTVLITLSDWTKIVCEILRIDTNNFFIKEINDTLHCLLSKSAIVDIKRLG